MPTVYHRNENAGVQVPLEDLEDYLNANEERIEIIYKPVRRPVTEI
jgi:hypothetical protein